MKTCLLVDNSSETKLIDKLFEHNYKLSTFKLEKCINLMLGNSKIVQKPIKKAFVDLLIKNHSKQLFCYLAKLNTNTVILGNR